MEAQLRALSRAGGLESTGGGAWRERGAELRERDEASGSEMWERHCLLTSGATAGPYHGGAGGAQGTPLHRHVGPGE